MDGVRRRWIVIAGIVLSSCACDKLKVPDFKIPDFRESARYEVHEDAQRRLVRFDRVSGAVAMWEGEQWVPVKGSEASSTGPTAKRTASAPRTAAIPPCR